MWWRIWIVFPQMSSLRIKKLLLYVFEDNEAMIKMIINGRSPTMRHVSRTHRVALDWLFDRINLDPKSKSSTSDTKNQFADILTKGNFTRDEWNHLLCLFNITHFSSTVCSETMAKRLQHDSGEEWVTAKIATEDESYCQDAVARIILDFSKPGEDKLWKAKSIDRKKASDHYYHEQWKVSPQQAAQKWDDDRAWSPSRVENWYWDIRAIGATW